MQAHKGFRVLQVFKEPPVQLQDPKESKVLQVQEHKVLQELKEFKEFRVL